MLATITPMTASPKKVEFWFDPSCPWCWMTSRWIVEVSQVRGFEIIWHPFSLKILNEGRDGIDQRHLDAHAGGLQSLRVIEAARAQHGDAIVGQLYTEIGTRFHKEGNGDMLSVLAESLQALDLDAQLLDAADAASAYTPGTTGIDAQLRESTAAGLALVGDQVGIPIIAIDGVGFFGPVVTPAPTGQQALDLFDGLALCMRVDGFYELKKTRTARPQF